MFVICFISQQMKRLKHARTWGRPWEYWPEVVAVRTATTKNSPVRPERARLVNCLLYGTRLLIVKCTSGGLHLKGFRRDVLLMTRATQTKASFQEFKKKLIKQNFKTLYNGIRQKQLLKFGNLTIKPYCLDWNMDQVRVKWKSKFEAVKINSKLDIVNKHKFKVNRPHRCR